MDGVRFSTYTQTNILISAVGCWKDWSGLRDRLAQSSDSFFSFLFYVFLPPQQADKSLIRLLYCTTYLHF